MCGSNLLSPGRFHLCVSQGRLDCLEVIIAHGADLAVPESAGRRLTAVDPLGVRDYSYSSVTCLTVDRFQASAAFTSQPKAASQSV